MEWMQVNTYSRLFKNKLQKNRSWYSYTILNQNKLSTQSEPILRWKYTRKGYMLLERAVGKNEKFETFKLESFRLGWKVQIEVGKFSMQY